MVGTHSILGQGLVLGGLSAAAAGSVLGFVAGAKGIRSAYIWCQRAAYIFAALMLGANLTMVSALLARDFSVSYVAKVGSIHTPTWVTIVSLWSSLDGSILFWGVILGGYVAAFTYANRHKHLEYMPYALGTIFAVALFFSFLIAGPANPFLPTEILPGGALPTDGPGPNPLLQNHILMVIHPPSLYLGYVGMTIPFGIAVAALLRGRLGTAWLKPLRIWTMIPWTFLGIGIILGGWWAYEVLGWGGYWAWDPVENASFHPWLAATAYLHASVATERRKVLKLWTLFLVLLAFLLTILGTFMTRSGVFNSVHSFTQSPIGPVFLIFLVVLSVFSLGLLFGRGNTMLRQEGSWRSASDRSVAMLVASAWLMCLLGPILFGTLYPLFVEAINGARLSVGEPYFNKFSIPVGLLIVVSMGYGPLTAWGKADTAVLLRRTGVAALIGLAAAAAYYALGYTKPYFLMTVAACVFATISQLVEIVVPGIERARAKGESFFLAWGRYLRGSRRKVGGYIAHLAIIAIAFAMAEDQNYRQSREAALRPGQSFDVGDYTFHLTNTRFDKSEAHRDRVLAAVRVDGPQGVIGNFEPSFNYYPTQREPIGTPDVQTVGLKDIYVSLVSISNDGQQVGLKAYVLPKVPLIWISIYVLAIGGVVSLWPRRRLGVIASQEPRA